MWGPFNRADQKAVERVQRRATRMVDSIRHYPYPVRLRLLRLPSIYYRRRRGDMIHVYQLLHRGVDIDANEFFTLNNGGSTRGHSLKLCKPRANCRVRQKAFAVRIVNNWNGLPANIANSLPVNIFKNRLDAHWESIWYSLHDSD